MAWIRRLFGEKRLNAELHAELRFHVDRLADDLMAQGMQPEDARREATLRFGGETQIAEDCRDVRGTARVESLTQDLRYAIRVLAKTPPVTATAVLAIALAISTNTLIFSGVHALLIKPLPYPGADSLFMLFGKIRGEDGVAFSTRELQLWQAGQKSFSEFGAFTGNGFTLTGRGEPLALFGALMTPGAFSALAVPATLGRVIERSDARPGRDHVVVLSDSLWRERFGADRAVPGQSIYLNNESYTVIGVMPPDFAFPERQYGLWVPATLESGVFQKFPDAHFLRTIGRLRPGVNAAQLQTEIKVLSKRFTELDPSSQRTVFSKSLAEVSRGPVRRPLLALMAAVGFLLLIACANVASILLARGTARYREFAVRVALGAARVRLIQHLVVESGLLALTGGALGVAIATVGVKLLSAVGASSLPGIETIKIDGPVLLFALGLSITTGLLFGFAPALVVARRAVAEGVRQGARSTGDRGTHRMQRTLVAVEVALSVMLVAGAGLFAHSFVRLSSTNPGFRPDHVLTASVAMNDASYPDEAKMLRFTRTVLEEARAIPGVDAAALATHMPFSGQGWGNSYDVEGHPAKPGTSYVAQIRPVSPDFFRALGIAIRQGKPFTEADRAKAAGVAIVNETLARRFWPNETAIGKRIRYGQDWLTIRAVVADIKHARLDQDTDPEIYIPYEQLPPGLMKFLGRSIYVIVHGSLDPASMGPALRRVIHAADPTIAVRGLTPLESMITESYAQSRFRTGLLVAFSVIALLLAGVGIYGVMSYLVAQRRQEIGVRLALGATHGGVVQMVVARALTVSTLGVLAGLIAAAALAATVRGLLYGVADYDPLAFTFAAGALIAVAAAASLAPALRAARTDPLTSLRVE